MHNVVAGTDSCGVRDDKTCHVVVAAAAAAVPDNELGADFAKAVAAEAGALEQKILFSAH